MSVFLYYSDNTHGIIKRFLFLKIYLIKEQNDFKIENYFRLLNCYSNNKNKKH